MSPPNPASAGKKIISTIEAILIQDALVQATGILNSHSVFSRRRRLGFSALIPVHIATLGLRTGMRAKKNQINPENPETLASYGYLMLWVGMNEKGIALLEEAMKLDPTNARVNQLMLQYYLARSDKNKQHVHIQSIMEHGDDESMKLFVPA